MQLVLVDTSVWVNFFKGQKTPASLYLRQNLGNILIATCPVIIQEILQGIINDKDFERIKNYFSDLVCLPANHGYDLSIQSAQIYRALRKKGITIRKPNDCLIACYALNNDIPLLHDDMDFLQISRHNYLKTIMLP
jgi:predicted nucleic acid-binding protein